MSRANIELARRGYEAFTTRDPEGVLGFLAPDIEAHDFPEMPDSAVYHGPEGFLALVRRSPVADSGWEGRGASAVWH
jgi:hypothetical protein